MRINKTKCIIKHILGDNYEKHWIDKKNILHITTKHFSITLDLGMEFELKSTLEYLKNKQENYDIPYAWYDPKVCNYKCRMGGGVYIVKKEWIGEHNIRRYNLNEDMHDSIFKRFEELTKSIFKEDRFSCSFDPNYIENMPYKLYTTKGGMRYFSNEVVEDDNYTDLKMLLTSNYEKDNEDVK